MKKIFKYRLPRDGETITITANVIKWLTIQEQDGWPMIWAVVDDTGYESEYEIVAWGTGWDFPDELNADIWEPHKMERDMYGIILCKKNPRATHLREPVLRPNL